MDANVTTSQSEHEQDNSSLQNPSTNAAEAGTTDETRDEDHETSSIEALNWSEVEEEELAAAQQATLISSTIEGKSLTEAKVSIKTDKDDESVTNNGSSTNDEGSMLSTMLLQSINSSVSDEDPQARKLTVIENWASEVTNAVERGEIELTEDFPHENGVAGDEEEEESNEKGLRKRKGKKLSPDTASSLMSSVSNAESNVDSLSNAPVLDDGPIWNKGPRSYTFQENRRINQKLTFCLVIAVVLAIGLGLGNLVAHQECEAEYKASQQSQIKPAEKISVQTVPTTTTPAPIIPARSTDSSMMGSSLPKKQPISYDDSDVPNENVANEGESGSTIESNQEQTPVSNNMNDNRRRRRDEPVIDPKYRAHAETVSNVVHTLDRLSREIDQFENTTRKLQGVLMIPEEKNTETITDGTLYDEEIHRDGDDGSLKNNDEIILEDEEDEEDDNITIDNLIDAIEQTPDYLELKKSEKRLEELNELTKNMPRSKVFSRPPTEPRDPEAKKDIEMILKSIQQFKDFERRFIKNERKKLREEGKYKRFSWRLPEEYTAEEKNALRVRYRSNWDEFLKLLKRKEQDPVEAMFGVEEDEEERTYGDVFHYPFPDPDLDLTPDEYDIQFRKNLKEVGLLPENFPLSENEKRDGLEDLTSFDSSTTSEDGVEQSAPATKRLEKLAKAFDDLIVSESKEEYYESTSPDVRSQEEQTSEDIGKSSSTEFDQSIEHAGTSLKPTDSQSTFPTDGSIADGMGTSNNDGERVSATQYKMIREGVPKVSVSKNSYIKAKDNAGTNDSDSSRGKGETFQTKSQTANGNNGKVDKQKIKESQNKQGKLKIRNGSNVSSAGGADNSKNPTYNDSSRSGNGKMSSKGKKLKNLESNKVFENIKGKNIDKRRDVSTEDTQRNFGPDTRFTDTKSERNFATNKKSATGSTKDEFGEQYGDTPSANQVKQKMKQTQKHHENDNQKANFNSKTRNYKSQPRNGPKHPDPREVRDPRQRRQENQYEKSKTVYTDERFGKPNQDTREASSKETKFRQQKVEFNRKYDYRNSDRDPNSAVNHPNGKRSKSWLSKEKTDRREKSR